MGTGDGFTLRRSAAWRVALGVWLVVWLGWMGFVVSASDESLPTPFVVVVALMLVYGVVMTVRTIRCAVVADGEELLVRNTWATHRLPRSAIAGFSTGRYQRIGHRTAYADRRSGGSVRLMAVEPAFPLPGRERAVEPALDRLEAWRTGVPAARARPLR